MKSIHTLIPDIYKLVGDKHENIFTADALQSLSSDIVRSIDTQFSTSDRGNSLRMSRLGTQCPRALWYSVNRPELSEPLPPWAEIKFSFGHILEALVLALARSAGHSVCGEQDELYLDGIKGHRDCVIDGYICDVKSCSTRSFQKFKDRSLAFNDSFGYLEQLDGYILASAADPLVTVKDRGYFIAIDKTLGHMVLYEHSLREQHIRTRIRRYKEICGLPSPPQCACGTRPEGKSGNIGLDVVASYSPYKYCCFPNLRTFLYSDGPRYLTHVARVPDVYELARPEQTIPQVLRS